MPSGSAQAATIPAGGTDGTTSELVVFGLGEERLALPMSLVREIVRMLPLGPVPRAPECLLGLANLRGRVLPVLDLRRLVGAPPREADDATRVLVLERDDGQLGLVVDRVLRVLLADPSDVEATRATSMLIGSEALAGVVRTGEGLVQILDLEGLLASRMAPETDGTPGQGPVLDSTGERDEAAAGGEPHDEDASQLVAFTVAGQEMALRIATVREIVRLPERIEAVPDAGPHALGMMSLRGRPLPLVSMAALLGLEDGTAAGGRVLVTDVPLGKVRARVGLVVDTVREVLRVPDALQDTVPRLLGRDDALGDIDRVCRLDGGRRLVPVVEVERLAVLDALHRTSGETEEDAMTIDDEMSPEPGEAAAEDDEVQLVVFQLDGEEYGLPVEVVQEITRLPERMSRVPRTPAWVEGLVNLRGAVLPVLDMRTRFGLPPAERSERQRILVLELGGARTGFVADSVTEVLSVPRGTIESAPRLSEEQARLMGRVVSLDQGRRMIVVLDPEALVDENEREALAETVRSAA